MLLKQVLFVTSFRTRRNFLLQTENASEHSICIFTQFVKLFSKTLDVNFKHFLGMELATDVIFLVISQVDNYLFIYLFIYAFASSVGCEIRYVDTAELNYIPYISARVTCTINFSAREIQMLKLKIWILSFLKGSKYLN